MRGQLALAMISDSLPLEVPIGVAILHEVAPRGAHKVGDDFLLLEDVVRLGQGYSTKILSNKGLTLAL